MQSLWYISENKLEFPIWKYKLPDHGNTMNIEIIKKTV